MCGRCFLSSVSKSSTSTTPENSTHGWAVAFFYFIQETSKNFMYINIIINYLAKCKLFFLFYSQLTLYCLSAGCLVRAPDAPCPPPRSQISLLSVCQAARRIIGCFVPFALFWMEYNKPNMYAFLHLCLFTRCPVWQIRHAVSKPPGAKSDVLCKRGVWFTFPVVIRVEINWQGN